MSHALRRTKIWFSFISFMLSREYGQFILAASFVLMLFLCICSVDTDFFFLVSGVVNFIIGLPAVFPLDS